MLPSESSLGGWPKWGLHNHQEKTFISEMDMGILWLCLWRNKRNKLKEHKIFLLRSMSFCLIIIIISIYFLAFSSLCLSYLCFYLPLMISLGSVIFSCPWESYFTSLGFNNVMLINRNNIPYIPGLLHKLQQLMYIKPPSMIWVCNV